jgi:hypothetical protein
MAATTESLVPAHKLQLHYWFSDKSHTMDALVYNKCERELLELTKAIASICGVSIKMETEPSGKGGLKNWLTIMARTPKKTPPAKVALVTTLVAACMVTPVHISLNQILEQLIETMGNESELSEGQKEQMQALKEFLKSEIAEKLLLLDQSSILKKRRSNFYDLLRKYQKVKSVSLVMVDDSRKPITQEQYIVRDSFKNFILVSDKLEPLVMENAMVEIISPVLSKGKYKWKGMYNNSLISFSMKSDEFMSLVHSGKVEFKSGMSIQCALEIERKINSEGSEKVISYNILRVGSYLENGKSVETTEGKQQKQKQQSSRRQLDLFG